MDLKSPPTGRLTFWNKSPVVGNETPKRRRRSSSCNSPFPAKRNIILDSCNLKISSDNFGKEINSVSAIELGQLGYGDELAAGLVMKFGFNVFQITLQALCHIPEKFPDRLTYITNIVKMVVGENFEMKEFESSVDLFERLMNKTRKFTPLDSSFREVLWNATDQYGEPYLNFLIPNVSVCLNGSCKGLLYPSEKSQVTIYKLTGPEPGLKTSFRCRACDTRYHLGFYSKPKQGRSFYGEKNRSVYKAASTRSFFSKDTYELMCESG